MGEATDPASVDRVWAGMVVATAVRMLLFPLSTPVTETRNRSSLRKIRTGSLVSELLNLPPPVVGAPTCLHNHQAR